MTFRFQAMWPIVDDRVPARQLALEAKESLPTLVRQAHARLTGPGAWTVEPAFRVPGSGNVTPYVLLFTAPAVRRPARAYHPVTTPTVAPGAAVRELVG